MKVKMERSRVFIGFKGLVFIIVLSASQTFKVVFETMLARIKFSLVVHFIIKIKIRFYFITILKH